MPCPAGIEVVDADLSGYFDDELEALLDAESGGDGRGAAAPPYRQLVPGGEPSELGADRSREVPPGGRPGEPDRAGPRGVDAVLRRRLREVFEHRSPGPVEQRERGGDDPMLERRVRGGAERSAERERTQSERGGAIVSACSRTRQMPVVASPSVSRKCDSALTARVQFGHTGVRKTESTPSPCSSVASSRALGA